MLATTPYRMLLDGNGDFAVLVVVGAEIMRSGWVNCHVVSTARHVPPRHPSLIELHRSCRKESLEAGVETSWLASFPFNSQVKAFLTSLGIVQLLSDRRVHLLPPCIPPQPTAQCPFHPVVAASTHTLRLYFQFSCGNVRIIPYDLISPIVKSIEPLDFLATAKYYPSSPSRPTFPILTMPRIPTSVLGKYLLSGQIPRRGCVGARQITRHSALPSAAVYVANSARLLHVSSETVPPPPAQPVPLRKQLKDEAKKAKKQGKKKSKGDSQTVDGWELTVGIEIHAQLNTARKLFSPAVTSFNDEPNSHVALFDLSMPGSQPLFQKETLIPALRAALALNCDIQKLSRFDRKHYFWWDQPSGYQITQYYEPFARNGHITLLARDGISPQDGESVTIGIKQVQLEQDTAKTLAQVDKVNWLDFNRVGVPLIEIITEPEMHHPRTAAVLVRKIQMLLNTVDACVSGMETGGLRADVNVSVRRTDGSNPSLGTRTEIKNLSTIKAVEDAIIAERDRQISELEAGRAIPSETRGWTLGSKETRRLRGKEGEVDYRYMPDPDIAPLVIGDDLVDHLRRSLAVSPDSELDTLIAQYGLTAKDALSLINLENGSRVQYFYKVLKSVEEKLAAELTEAEMPEFKSYSTLVGNWIIHELGRLTTFKAGPLAARDLSFTPEGDCLQVPDADLAQLLYHLVRKQITGKVAKELLFAIYLNEIEGGITQAIEDNDLWFKEIPEEEYEQLADEVMEGEDKVLQEFVDYKQFPQGKLMYLVGKMMRLGPTERIVPANAERVMRAKVEKLRSE
ncbi:Glutamyl-tRNA(Gln) amidotransferase subunit B, mitochondrial [Fusarium duplospermum]|uniref:Glutamyl-tRNA(Gln) amidotransferase subunit B, mitochondrial n=1 Tax=Fusarium duplospermum TaxID=1325734 RepID=A0A428R5R8_9HYPO|nr:Glutamyl-tRNA(Gln) amidotransferase subunit B, mitochondrial [Fusarium duplospermum]